jgi:hypothetical protein
MSPALQQLLHHSAVSKSWEMQVAALLLWALRLPPGSPVGSFWQQYRQLLPATVQECSSLLVWSQAELNELQVRHPVAAHSIQNARHLLDIKASGGFALLWIEGVHRRLCGPKPHWCVLQDVLVLTRFSMVLCLQDASLQATAEAWQQQVHEAYHSAVKPFFSHMDTPHGSSSTAASDNTPTSSHCSPTSSTSTSSTSNSSSSTPEALQLSPSHPHNSCSLEEWLWAVAVVESRAFGAARGDVAAAAAAAAEAAAAEAAEAEAEAAEAEAAEAEVGQTSSQPLTATAPAPNTTASTAAFTGLVPVLDQANHSHRPAYEHRLDPSTATFCLSVDCSRSKEGCNADVQTSSSSSSSSNLSSSQEVQQQQQQVLITYGSKDNRWD